MERKVCFIVFILCFIISSTSYAEGDESAANDPSKNVNKQTTPSDNQGTGSSDAADKPGDNVKCDKNSSCKNGNGTLNTDTGSFYNRLVENKGMLMRTFYVLLGVTTIVLIYFGVRAWRMRRRGSKSRKYGLIATRGADLEMEPLDGNDDDDDMTVFEVNGRQR